ncbi:hypothetical protein CR513_02611, partial [Mucuna pruriens]
MVSNKLLINGITTFIKSLSRMISRQINGISLLHENKKFLTKIFKMKDLGLIYTQICTHLNISLSIHLSDPIMQHWKTIKCAIRYLKRIKWYMLTYQKFDNLEIIEYSIVPIERSYQIVF